MTLKNQMKNGQNAQNFKYVDKHTKYIHPTFLIDRHPITAYEHSVVNQMKNWLPKHICRFAIPLKNILIKKKVGSPVINNIKKLSTLTYLIIPVGFM